MKDWYDRIEEPIRPLVKLLRDNGYNTTCSCGHEMYVQCEQDPRMLSVLKNLLYNNGYRDFSVFHHIDVVGGCVSEGIEIRTHNKESSCKSKK